MNNNLKQNENGAENIITEIKNKSVMTTCGNTINQKKWTRNCPKCNKELSYTRHYTVLCANKDGWLCHTCNSELSRTYTCSKNIEIVNGNSKYVNICNKCNITKKYFTTYQGLLYSIKHYYICRECGKVPSVVYTRECPKCKKKLLTKNKLYYNKAVKNNSLCLSCVLKGRKFSDETKKLMSKNHTDISGDKNPSKRCDVRRNLRLKKIARISIQKFEGGQVVPFYNSNACKYFDELNKQNGWNLQHAMNGGEFACVGYFLDAYDKERNIVVEYDEKHHYNSLNELQDKDVYRQNTIIKSLQCKFFRYNENIQELCEVKDEKNNKN